ncbi:hypothetical protein OMP38_23350 [Cohnella ginsengisoli]|uniref:Glycosyl transferase family 28 C-terminal domain-containing protein n=1 Tax=Cohnella ginsengisoli TaxID=425004 RepID=A0A9X4QPF2_9BACL|nr:glycosyltransferase [Cohnella ginsengisoli]MDG0793447.1 hypothetical protein [Cohnella ginsengisoli]
MVGFIENMESYLSVASCIVTKAGAITLTEAIAMQVPVVVYRPIPGQEQGNAEYWEGRHALRTAGDAASAKSSVERLISERSDMEAGAFGDASQAIVSEVLNAHASYRASRRTDTMIQGRRIAHEIH